MPRLDWRSLLELTFEPPDTDRFPMLSLAYRVGRRGGTLPAVMSAANEVAVNLFLGGKISFNSIYSIVEEVVGRHSVIEEPGLSEILECDSDARNWARRLAANSNS